MNITLATGDFLPITMLWVDLDGPGELAIGIYDNETDINYTDTTGLFYLPRYTDQFSNQLPIQYVVEPITTAGSLLSTETTFGVGDPTETFAVVEPTPIITTIISGSLAFTSKMAGAGGQPTVTVVLPANYGLVNSFYNNPCNLYSNNFDPGYFYNDGLQLIACGTALNINFKTDQENLGN